MPDPYLAGHAVPCPACAGAGHILAVDRTGWHPAPCPARCCQGRVPKPPERIVADMLAEAAALTR